jgi:hypothetical protein
VTVRIARPCTVVAGSVKAKDRYAVTTDVSYCSGCRHEDFRRDGRTLSMQHLHRCAMRDCVH